MNIRNLERHQLVKLEAGSYHLKGHPEVAVTRHEYNTRGSRGKFYWLITFKGSQYTFNGHRNTHHDLEAVDRELGRFGACEDCGTFCRRDGHPFARCAKCHQRHEELRKGFAAGAAAARRVEALWGQVERIRAAGSAREAVEAML